LSSTASNGQDFPFNHPTTSFLKATYRATISI